MTRRTALDREVERLKRTHERALTQLAARVRRELLIPACRKHRLTFRSGNGTWVLSAQDAMLSDAEEADRKGYKLRRLFTALETRVGDWPRGSVTAGGPELGMYMDDYDGCPREDEP